MPPPPSPPRDAYCSLVPCSLVALDKHPGVRPVGMGETLCRAITKIVMRAAADQTNMACGSLQMCAGLGASIEGETHTVAQRRREQNVSVTEGRDNKESVDGRTTSAPKVERVGGESEVGVVGEVTVPPGGIKEIEQSKGGASNKLRTAMGGTKLREEDMDEGEAAEADEEKTEAEWGGLGGPVGTGSLRATNSGCGSRRHNPCLCPQWLQ